MASMLHAVALMPIEGLDNTPIFSDISHTSQHSPQHHAHMAHSTQQDIEHSCCPTNSYACCLAMTLQTHHLATMTPSLNKEIDVAVSLSKPDLRAETLYKPPKVDLV